MSRTQYRGFTIEVVWKDDHRYAVHLFPFDQANARRSRAHRPGGFTQDTILTEPDGSYRYVTSVTEGVEAARTRIDQLRDAA